MTVKILQRRGRNGRRGLEDPHSEVPGHAPYVLAGILTVLGQDDNFQNDGRSTLKQGHDYELFIYEKLKALYPDSIVTLNDLIPGVQSGIDREIDISIRTAIPNGQVLQIVQCKDRKKRPADITILGEFSSALKDVCAARGFLFCTSGFARTNHQYAKTLGIELFTIEDINSDRWPAAVQIPLVFVDNVISWEMSAEMVTTAELVEKNKVEVQFRREYLNQLSLDAGLTTLTLGQYIDSEITRQQFDVFAGGLLVCQADALLFKFDDIWVPLPQLGMRFTNTKRRYLKYLSPIEYSQLRDHVRGTTIPLHVVVRGTFDLDDSYIPITGDSPVFPALSLEIERKPTSFADMEITALLGLEQVDAPSQPNP
jgi:hypothetical protein